MDTKNLWPKPKSPPNKKDRVEHYLHKQVYSGAMPLAQAQKKAGTDLYNIYTQIR